MQVVLSCLFSRSWLAAWLGCHGPAEKDKEVVMMPIRVDALSLPNYKKKFASGQG